MKSKRISATFWLGPNRDVECVASGIYRPAVPGDADAPAQIDDLTVTLPNGVVLALDEAGMERAEDLLIEEATR